MAKNRGSSATSVITGIQELAPPPLINSPDSHVEYVDNQLSLLLCPVCCSVLSQPVDLGLTVWFVHRVAANGWRLVVQQHARYATVTGWMRQPSGPHLQSFLRF